MVLFDISMPQVDGLTATRILKEKFENFNAERKRNGSEQLLLRPLICQLTQFGDGIKQFITDEERADLFLRKPLTHRDLSSLLKLLQLL